jgi:hypothetical protein
MKKLIEFRIQSKNIVFRKIPHREWTLKIQYPIKPERQKTAKPHHHPNPRHYHTDKTRAVHLLSHKTPPLYPSEHDPPYNPQTHSPPHTKNPKTNPFAPRTPPQTLPKALSQQKFHTKPFHTSILPLGPIQAPNPKIG